MADPRVDINARTKSGDTPLQDAVYADLGQGPDVAVVILRHPRIVLGAREIEQLKRLIGNAQSQPDSAGKVAEIKKLMATR